MRPFAEVVAEAFESEVSLVWRLESTTRAIGVFEVNSIRVEVSFERREHNGPWHVGFNTVQGESADRTNPFLAFPIFNGVFQAVREFIEVRQPDVVVFIAKDEHVERVYETYLRREKASMEDLGYTLEGPHTIEPYTEWSLRRLRPSSWRRPD